MLRINITIKTNILGQNNDNRRNIHHWSIISLHSRWFAILCKSCVSAPSFPLNSSSTFSSSTLESSTRIIASPRPRPVREMLKSRRSLCNTSSESRNRLFISALTQSALIINYYAANCVLKGKRRRRRRGGKKKRRSWRYLMYACVWKVITYPHIHLSPSHSPSTSSNQSFCFSRGLHLRHFFSFLSHIWY